MPGLACCDCQRGTVRFVMVSIVTIDPIGRPKTIGFAKHGTGKTQKHIIKKKKKRQNAWRIEKLSYLCSRFGKSRLLE